MLDDPRIDRSGSFGAGCTTTPRHARTPLDLETRPRVVYILLGRVGQRKRRRDNDHQYDLTTSTTYMRMWRSGSASPCQGEGREFESRHPLERRSSDRCHRDGTLGPPTPNPVHGGLAERRGSGLQSRIHGFESRIHLDRSPSEALRTEQRAIGAAVARFPDTEEVTGSIPVSPTTRTPGFGRGFLPL